MLHKLYNQSTINTDLKMISTFLQTSLQPKMQPRNVSELSEIIKNRLAQTTLNKEQKINCKQWLKDKGMNIQPLLQHLNFKKKNQSGTIDQETKQDTLGNAVMQPILFNHEQYSKKALEYASTSLLQFISTNRIVRKRHFKNAMMRLGCSPTDPFESSLSPITLSYSPRDKTKRQKYIKAVKQLLDIELRERKANESHFQVGDQCSSDDTAKLFSVTVSHKLWKIIYRQVRNVDFSKDKPHLITELLINSLGVVQEEFNEDLPLNKQASNIYLQQKYLSKFQRPGEYVFHPEHGSIWGKIFLFFRAGRLKEALDLLQSIKESTFIRDIEINAESIKQKNPKKTRIDGFLMKEIKDVFREQILYALGGQRKYSSDVLVNTSSLDCVWVLLRNTGIYYFTDNDLFEDIRTQMIDFYRRSKLQREYVYYGAYLLDYDSLVKCNESQILDKDDLMHLMILLQRYPVLIKNREYLQHRLTQYAVSYAIQLANQDRKEYVYYLLMIPPSRLVEETSSIIATNKLYSTIKWQILKQYLPEKLFQSLIIASSQKFIISTNSYIQAANIIVDHINGKNAALDLLSEMLIGHIKQKKIYGGEEVSRALRLYYNWMSEESELDKLYSRLFELLNNSIRLSRALIDRNFRSIQDLIANKNLIFGQNVGYYNNQMLQKLLQFKGLQVFFIYMSSLMRAADIVFTTQGHHDKLKQYKYQLYKTSKTVTDDEKYKKVCSGKSIFDLIEQLSSGLIQDSFDIYRTYK